MNDEELGKLEFADNATELDNRYKDWYSNDPFPRIEAALLNFNDIFDYARVTGMVHPFPEDETIRNEKLKIASYEIDFLGEVYFVNDKNKRRKEELKKGEPFTLKKNSIVFVHLQTEFRLPSYIALRFNLRITHVHRGLLLGTGPLIDPGFCGRLLVPLHNLTAEDYILTGGEGLIWVEFTKLSKLLIEDVPGRQRLKLKPSLIPPKRTAQEYFNRASGGTPAKSSIPTVFESARATAEEAKKKVNTLFWSGIFGLTISVAALVGSTWNLISNANKSLNEATKSLNDASNNTQKFQTSAETLDEDQKRTQEQITSLQTRLANIQAQVDAFRSKNKDSHRKHKKN